MRHIKLFEDYSEEELRDLIGDLKSVGLVDRPVLGEDFGFTSELLKEPPNPREATNLYFTPETVEYMIKHKMAEFSGLANKKSWVRFLPDNKKWDSSWGSYGPGNYLMRHSLYLLSFGSGKKLYQLVGISGDYGFGGGTTKKVGTKARLHCQRQFLEKFQEFINETH